MDKLTLKPPAFRPLPLGTLRPRGWLEKQLRIQADSLSGKLDEFWPEATVEVHPTDAERLGVTTGDWLRATSRRGSIELRAMVTGRSPEGMAFIPFHFVEAAANVLTNDRLDPRAKIPDFKVCAIRLERIAPPADRDPATQLPLAARGAIKDPSVQVH